MHPLSVISRRWMLRGAALAACAAPARAQYPVNAPPPCNTGGRSAVSLVASTSATARRLVVLPFATSPVPGPEGYLADAYPERIAARLGRARPRDVALRDVRQVDRPETARNAAALGRTMGATYVVTGSVMPSARGGAITVQLLKSADGSVVWSSRYDPAAGDLLVLEGDVAREIATHAFGSLTAAERSALAAAPTANVQAYGHFLRGNGYFAVGTLAAMADAVRELTAAVQADPKFAAALSRLAMAYALWLEAWTETPTRIDAKVLPAGLAAATSALQADPRSSEAWLARAILLERQSPRTLSGARSAYGRAIDLDPANAEAHRRFGQMLADLGEIGAARSHLRQALAVQPGNGRALTTLADLSLHEREYAEACRLLNTAILVQPTHPGAYVLRALARIRFREFRDAWSDAELGVRLGQKVPGEAAGAIVDLAARDTARARARLKRLTQRPAGAAPLSVREGRYLAIALTALGHRAEALSALERVAPRGVSLWRAMHDPQLSALGGEARFQRLLAASRPRSGD